MLRCATMHIPTPNGRTTVLAFAMVALGCTIDEHEPPPDSEHLEEQLDPALATPTDPPDRIDPPNCGGALAPAAIEVEWNDLPNPRHVEPSAAAVSLTATNITDRKVHLQRLRVVGDAAGRAIHHELADVVLDPAEERTWTLPLSDLAIDAKAMQVSGVLVLEAELADDSDTPIGRTASEPLYFHPVGTDGKFAVYGETAMREQFASGDFVGARDGQTAANPPNPRRRRLMQGSFEIPGGAQ